MHKFNPHVHSRVSREITAVMISLNDNRSGFPFLRKRERRCLARQNRGSCSLCLDELTSTGGFALRKQFRTAFAGMFTHVAALLSQSGDYDGTRYLVASQLFLTLLEI